MVDSRSHPPLSKVSRQTIGTAQDEGSRVGGIQPAVSRPCGWSPHVLHCKVSEFPLETRLVTVGS